MNQSDVFYQKGIDALSLKKSDAALEFFTQAADLGNLDAPEKIISINYNEKNFEEYQAAVEKFFSIATSGNIRTAKNIFNLISNGELTAENISNGVRILLNFASAGHVESLKFLCELVETEKISQEYAAEIFKLLERETKKSHAANLMFRLGECYFFGVGIEKNLNAAKFWFQLLVNLEMAKDIFEKLDVAIAKTYLSNKFNLDAIKSLKKLKRRAQNGDSTAVKAISEICCKGTGITQDGALAIEFLKEISTNTNLNKENRLEALRTIAEIYRYGFGGVEADTEIAIHYFELMIDTVGKNAFAARNIAEIYFNGEGNIKADRVKAVNWMRIAANYGNLYCMKKLADFYAAGNFIEKNEAEAISLYEKIIARSDMRSRIDVMKKIAHLYKNIDKEKSDEWYKKAEVAKKNLNFAQAY